MSLRPETLRGASGAGTVDHRLARRFLISEYRKGRLARHQVCDAHPELVRAARHIGSPVDTVCPICADAALVHVTYVFGARLPAHGRCVTTAAEMAKLDRRADQLMAYVVEVCPECSWHHLVRTVPVGGRANR
jgi:hypothetical protein